ncbi:MAG: hypothetical protein LC797_00030 [Chloroflexi bacterium]|nr:hypothetical protein [Chloroflexota bacterium]
MLPDTDSPWLQTFGRLQPNEQQTLVRFLLDMALISKARAHDFAAMARLLEVAVREEHANTPLCAQSAELLSRTAVFAESKVAPS